MKIWEVVKDEKETINPYLNALDGLELKDPVSDFLIFVKKEKN